MISYSIYSKEERESIIAALLPLAHSDGRSSDRKIQKVVDISYNFGFSDADGGRLMFKDPNLSKMTLSKMTLEKKRGFVELMKQVALAEGSIDNNTRAFFNMLCDVINYSAPL